jgi:hypothetical protein
MAPAVRRGAVNPFEAMEALVTTVVETPVRPDAKVRITPIF